VVRSGQGRFLSQTTDRRGFYEYNGEWYDDQRHGVGACFYQNGNYYNGDWQLGSRHGMGTMVKSSGETYNGLWEND